MKQMSNRLIERATVLANRYKSYKKEGYKVKARNALYELLQPWLCYWVNCILKRWHFVRSDEEVLSYSFSSLLFAIDYWKPSGKYSLPGHFYAYTKYHLLIELAKETKVNVELGELRDTLSIFPTDLNVAFGSLLTLVELKNCLPEFAKPAFDDAVSTVVHGKSIRRRMRRIDSNIYSKLKSSFTPIVTYFVRKELKE